MLDVGAFLHPGDGVWWGQGSAEPEQLVNQVLDAVDEVGPIRAFSGLTWNARLSGDLPELLTVISYGGLGQLRRLSRNGLLDVVPCHYSALPRMFAKGQLPCDVGLMQVSPPDSDGLVTLGIGVEYVADAIPHTRTLIAEINQQMPATVGGPKLPLSAFAAIIETDRPLVESPKREPDEVELGIAKNVASIIDDGDTIQIGVGSLPEAVLDALAGHADLGFHSGMTADGVFTLVEKGVITGARKEIDAGLVITGAAFGTRDYYDRLHEFPVEFRPASYTHAPGVLSQLRSLVSINSAIEVDLLGQVGAELARGVHIGAVGGQVDFSRAAALTGSRSIIALRSTNGSGEQRQSTIVPSLHGGVVTTSRVDVDAVVTEHGVAMLTGCTVAERALRLIEVAAPEHREELERALADQEY
ncbi:MULTISPECIES: acetyl-CoA hydrolase/transferase family protein [unclassified Nocardioides]|uniref:acetyl-CoA hydrolase/transferase family protein n=1 Tax=unclassified Nocardioides TaxID=2615069 RepID=UPI0006F5AB14|nr:MULTISPECIES: acetyl-CoA hydrolase/transferase C-terminal domain-containing protein [unclassified Nocardioides]KQY50066.1 4-hydroxybutyrate CoA-transferase [Nocardioides sp. Root140]KQZ75690.1 4-hydroxybutyrate CoA-transferase [Nocardioides sp. Root151]KRF14762.1 4-hydroxybutyrate CoA-transferase [Nocardioides sp. Soil796]